MTAADKFRAGPSSCLVAACHIALITGAMARQSQWVNSDFAGPLPTTMRCF